MPVSGEAVRKHSFSQSVGTGSQGVPGRPCEQSLCSGTSVLVGETENKQAIKHTALLRWCQDGVRGREDLRAAGRVPTKAARALKRVDIPLRQEEDEKDGGGGRGMGESWEMGVGE